MMKNSLGKQVIQIVLLLLALIAFGFMMNSSAQDEGVWVDCYGEVVLHHLSMQDAQVLAKRQARRQAIEKVCGIALQSETLVNNFRHAGDFIHAISCGNVAGERNLQWTTRTHERLNSSQPPLVILCLSMQVRVIPVHDNPDAGFQISAKPNRTVFQNGDEIFFNIQSTKDCYITVFNLCADDSVYILFPNLFQQEHYLKSDSLLQIPSEINRKNGYRFRVSTLSGHYENSESITVIGTKNKVPFWDNIATENVGTPRIAMTKLSRWLSEIPLSQRAESSFLYSVHSDKTGDSSLD